ncbi:MAG: indole-3-glycerol phosphate synthase TrpC [Chthoniobacterales bacterium]
MSRLEDIISAKKLEVEQLKARRAELEEKAHGPMEFRGFRAALERDDGQLAIIAEVKKASPSAGLIAPDFDPVKRATEYEIAGAEAISVLTDQKFFQGSLFDLIAAREAVSVPLLRKDFIIDEIQIVEAAGAGADAVLLIVAALNDADLLRLSQLAAGYHLDALVEVHSVIELDRALAVGAQIIGINNRNLATFEVDLAVTEQISELVPHEVSLVSESGFKSVADVQRAHRCGVDAILVGEALMRGGITIQELRNL